MAHGTRYFERDPGAGYYWKANANNVDASAAGQTVTSLLAAGAVLLATMAVNTRRIGFLVQQQSASTVWVVMDDGGSGTQTTLVLDPAGAAGRQGGSVDMSSCPHSGRIRVYGTSGSQVAVAEW